MRKIFAVLMIGTAFGLVACDKSDTKTYSDANGNKVSVSNSNDHMTITGSNGEKVEFGSGANATAKLPSFLTVYPGATVTTSYSANGQKGSGGVVVLHAHAVPGDVIAFYKGKAKAAGLPDTMTADMGGTMVYAAGNDTTKNQLSISATKAADGSDVQITWSTK